MYDLPKDVDLNFLKGRQLELLCFAPYSLTLHFERGTRIQIEGSFKHSVDGKAGSSKTFPLASTHLTRLLSQTIVKVSVKPDGGLSLAFSNGDLFAIEGNVGPYESYQVQAPDRDLIVV
ncbi:MAG TPA: DUF6188 family protein [Stellaceae bacterium]|nr:DUF6188 family protein [Stellaceae bacterium]